ncbi:MAG: DUF1302 family protein [Sphaerochaeta sp.]
MNKKIITGLTVSLIILSNLSATDVSLHGNVRNYIGVLPTQDFEYAIMQDTFNLTLEYYGDNSDILVNPYMNYDLDDELSVDLREAYINLYLDDADIRIGKQQIVWGKSDGLFITDVVSPKNLQEFLLPDFNEIRLGVTAIKADYYIKDSTWELIWIPIFTPDTLPDEDSIWNAYNIDFGDTDEDIDASLENSEIFGRYSTYTSNIDYEIMGGYMWDDEPTVNSSGEFTHYRTGILGGSMSSSVGDFIIRSDGAWYIGKQITASLEMDYLHYMIGLDYKIEGWNLSTQLVQKVYLNYEENSAVDQWTNTITFMANKEFLENTVLFEFFTYIEFDDLNALIRPKVTYSIFDDTDLLLGANIFLGDSGTFGQFEDNDMIYTKVTYSF